MAALIDFHSHVLPGMDDGSQSVEQSLSMLRMAAQQGVTHIVATPHFYADRDTPARFLERRKKAEALLRTAMAREEGLPELLMGAEVHYFAGISEASSVRSLAIDGGKCLLLEMPEHAWTDSMYQELEQFAHKQGILPVLAHLDRYVSPWHNRNIPARLSKLPVAVQANASFFLRSTTRPLALKLLQQEQIHILGSDCHNLTTRKPRLAEAAACIQRRLGTDALLRIYAESCSLLNIPVQMDTR